MEKTSQRRLVILAIALVGVLLLLVAGLRQIELSPGYALPFNKPAPGVIGGGDDNAEYGWASMFLRVVIIAGVVAVLIGSIFIKEMRNYLYMVLIGIALLLVVSFFSDYFESRPQAEPLDLPTGAESLELPHEVQEIEPIPEAEPASDQAVLILAILVSAGIVVGLFVAGRAILAKRRRDAQPFELPELDELVHSLDAAATRIRAGDDPRTVVLLCYREMVDILSRRGRIVHQHLTPREFARSLVDAGMAEHHVDELTEVFELVRYGERSGQELANRAILSLDAIRDAYEAILP